MIRWEKVKLEEWKEVPFVSGRVATEEDIKNEMAVFCIPSGSEAYETELPLFAIQTTESDERIPCIIIQIENSPEGTFVGARYFEGGNGVGIPEEYEFFNGIPDDFSL